MTTVHMMTIEGEAPPAVMLDGLGGTSNSFRAMVLALAGFAKTVILSRCGHWTSIRKNERVGQTPFGFMCGIPIWKTRAALCGAAKEEAS